MSDPFEVIGHGIKVGAEDVAKGTVEAVNVVVIQPIEFCVKAEKVLASAIKDQPIVRDAVVSLVKQATTVIDDFKANVADGLIDLKADEQTLADAQTFFNWFKSTFIPTVEQVYGDIAEDVQ